MKNVKTGSYRDLIVWQKAVELSIAIYHLTDNYPEEELYVLTSQMRRAAVSVASNIAEGKYRGTKKEFAHFLRISFSSGAELETQIEISKRLPKTRNLNYNEVDTLLREVMSILNVIIKKLS